MPKHFRVPRALFRCLAPGVLLSVVFFAAPDSALGQHTTGFNASKTCPLQPVPAGSSFNCTFSITNQDPQHGVINLAVTNQVPFPGGPITPVSCTQNGSPVTTLGAAGTVTDTCTGTIPETAPACGPQNIFFSDHIEVTGEDAGVPGLPVQSGNTNSVTILACTPTPTPTATNTPTTIATDTPTNTPTNTVTNTPVTTAPPPVPTLSFPMMVLLGLLLAGAGLFFARRP